jgi:hypothetical protein
MDPVSAIANAIGGTAGAVGDIWSSTNNLKATKVQSAAEKYIAGQITEQEYLKLQAQESNNLTGTVNGILSAKQKPDYLPYILISGIILVVVVSILKRKQ